jgi:protein O-GlcNAc transferase
MPDERDFRLLSKGIHYHNQGILEKAEYYYLRFLKSSRTELALYNYGILLQSTNRLLPAQVILLECANRYPMSARAKSVLGLVLDDLGQSELAYRYTKEAALLAPDQSVYKNNFGKVCNTIGNYCEAELVLRESLEIDPRNYGTRYNLSVTLLGQHKYADAERLLIELHHENPDQPDVSYRLADIYRESGDQINYLTCLRKALFNGSSHYKYSGEIVTIIDQLLLLNDVKIIQDDVKSADITRDRLVLALQYLNTSIDKISLKKILENENLIVQSLCTVQPFYWAYLGFNDRHINELYVGVIRQLLPRYVEFQNHCPVARRTKPIVAVISENIGLHVTRWIGGLLREFKDEISIHHVVLNGLADRKYESDLFNFSEIIYLNVTFSNLFEIVNTIKHSQYDLLIYPDIGMTPITRIMSCFRLSVQQAAHWGHPVTTGSSSIDYFISSELMEPDDCDSHYTEKLYPLANFGLWLDLAFEGGIIKSEVDFQREFVVLSIQSTFKYHPSFDFIYVLLAKAVPRVKFQFLEYSNPAVSHQFRNRLRECFLEASLDPDAYLFFKPRMGYRDYLDFVKQGDLVLDSFGWSGGNTFLDAMVVGKPVITLTGDFMRSRHSAAGLTHMGVEELVCKNIEELLSRFTTICENYNVFRSVCSRVLERRMTLNQDQSVLTSFKNFLELTLQKSPPIL